MSDKVIITKTYRPDSDYWLVGRILDKIYKSEINFSLGWVWDGGVDYKIGADLSYLVGQVLSTDCDEICDAIIDIANNLMFAYPDSEFSLWWRDIGGEYHPVINESEEA